MEKQPHWANDPDFAFDFDDDVDDTSNDVPDVGMTDEEIEQFLNTSHGSANLSLISSAVIADVNVDKDTQHTSAAIMLMADEATRNRLSPLSNVSDELHCTLYYFDDASQFSETAQSRFIDLVQEKIRKISDVYCDGFGISYFNPGDNGCVVLTLSGQDLTNVHNEVGNGLRNFFYHDNEDYITAAFDPHEKRDPHSGKWISVSDTALGTLKKAIPAIIYKKHEHNTVVAHSHDKKKRIRWDAPSKKYVQESYDENNSWHLEKSLTKTQAYDDLKSPDKWFSDASSTSSTSIVSEPSKESSATKIETPNVETPKSTVTSELSVSQKGLTLNEKDELSAINSQLIAIDKEAEKWRQIQIHTTHKASTGKVLTPNDLYQSGESYKKLSEFREQGTILAKRKLELFIKNESSPWGNIDTDAEKWVNLPEASTTYTSGVDKVKLEKIRDQYVVNDKMTIANNASLRSSNPTPAAKAWRGRINRLTQSQTLNENANLYRGYAFTPEMIMMLRPGTIMHDKGSMSTDTSMGTANGYANDRIAVTPGLMKAIFTMRVPKGKHIADVGYGEHVLPPDTSMKIISSSMDDNDVVHVIAEVV